MVYISGDHSTDPFFNAALEEYCLRQLPVEEAVFLMYVNETAVVIGRNQNIFEETNPDYLRQNGIHLVRRVSGGGTVYHDAGNLNFSFIVPGRDDIHRFDKFTEPIVRVLALFGLDARMEQNGSLFVGEKKISGHAQYAAAKRLLSHGTLLFDADLEKLSPALQPKVEPYDSNGVSSIRSPVTNCRPLLPQNCQFADLQSAVRQELFADGLPRYELSSNDLTAVQQLAEEKYRTWEWTYGRNPRFVLIRDGRSPAGNFELHLEINNGRISDMAIYCDFFDRQDPARLSEQFVGLAYNAATLRQQLQQVDLTQYFGTISADDFLEILY